MTIYARRLKLALERADRDYREALSPEAREDFEQADRPWNDYVMGASLRLEGEEMAAKMAFRRGLRGARR